MHHIDAHIHVTADDGSALALLDELDVKLMNVNVAKDVQNTWRRNAAVFERLARAHPARFAWCTALNLPDFDNPGYVDRAIRDLAADFAKGAVGCKFWKNIGMELKKPDGSFLMIDDPLFDPIYAYLADTGKPALMHMAEPRACWEPLDPAKPHYGYYSAHPEWHMYGKPDFPSHAAIVRARDNVLEKHPNVRHIGAHLGSLEYDVAEMAQRLDRYPHFAVDMSARLSDLMVQDRETVRQFFFDYQDRILFGTDVVNRTLFSTMEHAQRQKAVATLREVFEAYFAFLESDTNVAHGQFTARGLALPTEVLEKVYAANAREWFPGV
ncbi:MAG: amidohydrolase family protein [Kiritimatiellae bacterium]|nr:amidohydrolase family protein [Kiritimatiellia bacterium]